MRPTWAERPLCSALIAALAWCAAGQESQVAIQPRARNAAVKRSLPNLRLDLNVVLIPVTVTDAMDRPVTNLSRDHFRVLEDGVEQSICSFSQEDAPVSLGLLFDTSGSMKNRLSASVESMRLLFQTKMPGDDYFVIQFADRPHLLGGFTEDPGEIQRRLGHVQAHGWTSLLDAIALGVHQMKSARNRRVLLILSDGNDNNSRYSEPEIRNMVIEGNVRVYAIGLAHRPRLLQQLAEETGGSVLIAQHVDELPDVVQKLSREIRSQYLVGYSSSRPSNDGKYHKVKVELTAPPGTPPLRASWRHGYYAPED